MCSNSDESEDKEGDEDPLNKKEESDANQDDREQDNDGNETGTNKSENQNPVTYPRIPNTYNLFGSELQKTLRKLTLSQEMLRQLRQPALDLSNAMTIQKPLIDPKVLEQLTAPAIDQELINALNSLKTPELVRIYESAAAHEQAEQISTKEFDETSIKEVEEPERGGFLSTFFNFTAAYLSRTTSFPTSQRTILAISSVQRVFDRKVYTSVGSSHQSRSQPDRRFLMQLFTHTSGHGCCILLTE